MRKILKKTGKILREMYEPDVMGFILALLVFVGMWLINLL